MKIWYFYIGLIIMIFMSACSSNGQDLEEQMVIPQPEPGMASVTGRVLSKKNGSPFTGTIVRLAEVVREEGSEGLYILDQAFSPGTKTNDNGLFVFENVEAMEYVIIVGDVESIYEVITNESGTPQTWEVLSDEILDVGDLHVLLEPTQP